MPRNHRLRGYLYGALLWWVAGVFLPPVIVYADSAVDPVAPVAPVDAFATAPGAVMRGLDRLSGQTTEIPAPIGDRVRYGALDITVVACRYPVRDPGRDAYAYVIIDDWQTDQNMFRGWMIMASPGLNALDHPRYDVWVLNCTL